MKRRRAEFKTSVGRGRLVFGTTVDVVTVAVTKCVWSEREALV